MRFFLFRSKDILANDSINRPITFILSLEFRIQVTDNTFCRPKLSTIAYSIPEYNITTGLHLHIYLYANIVYLNNGSYINNNK